MAHLLIVHHSPTPALRSLLGAVIEGAQEPSISDVTVSDRAALDATPSDVLGADGYVLGTPANLGYMSGALKHFFDTIYNPCLGRTERRPFGIYVHGATDTTGAVLAIERIVSGLNWNAVHNPVTSLGDLFSEDLEAAWELGATLAATMAR